MIYQQTEYRQCSDNDMKLNNLISDEHHEFEAFGVNFFCPETETIHDDYVLHSLENKGTNRMSISHEIIYCN